MRAKKLKIENPIGDSLITDGTNTWLKTYGKYSENKQYADTMRKNLNGQKGPNNGKVKPSDYDRYVLMNEDRISNYLSQTAPVPFSKELDIKDQIEDAIKGEYKDYRLYNFF